MFYTPRNTVPEELSALFELSHRGRPARLLFTGIIGFAGLLTLPWHVTLGWVAFIFFYETLFAPIVVDQWINHPNRLSLRQRMFRLHLFSGLFGATLYALLPFALTLTDTKTGLFMAFAWVSGTAIHCFVYFSKTRDLLISHFAPTALLFCVGLILSEGVTLNTLVMLVTFACTVVAASLFATDRNVLLDKLADEKAARDAAEEANTAKSQFLATMSHELRTPLNAVIGYAEIIAEDLQNKIEPNESDVTKIRSAAEHLLTLINDVLDLSKLDAGRTELHCEPTNLNAILRDVRDTLTPLAQSNQNILHVSSGLSDELFEVDPKRLRQCLLNLGANACKFTENGQISIAAREEADKLVFVVKDTGPGIALEAQRQLFQPFTQVDSGLSRKHDGSGLGLAITRTLARLMGGDVTLESAPAKGATFSLEIALNRSESLQRVAA